LAKDTKEMLEARQGLVQFIGAMINRISYQGADARQVLCAILMEETLKLITVEDKIELFSAKPILRATNMILTQRINEYEESLQNEEVPEEIAKNVYSLRSNLIKVQNTLNDFISKIQKEG